MAGKGGESRRAILKDGDVARWYGNTARGSQATADNYLRILGRFLELNHLTAKGYVRLPPKKQADILDDHITRLLRGGLAGSTAAVVKKAVASWLDHNGKHLVRKIKVPGLNHRPTLRDAHIPTQDELKRVLNVADARSRTAIALLGFTGLRPEVLGNYLGTDGLRLRDLPEARLTNGELSFATTPTRVVVPAHLSKTGRSYFGFLGPEGCSYLAASVRERVESGETITLDSPVITPRWANKPFMRSLNVSDLIRKPMRAAGLKLPPYIWRSYYSSRTMLAEAKGFTRDFREFTMGHSGGVAHVYAFHKQLPPDAIEAMRRGYEAALEFLETQGSKAADPTSRIVGVLLQAAGYTAQDVAQLDVARLGEEDVVALLRRAGRPTPVPPAPARRPSQRVVADAQLDEALRDGWVFRASLPGGRAILDAPGGPAETASREAG